MWTPSAAQLAAALDHAGTCQPAESCGLIAAGEYRPLDNQSEAPDHFLLAAGDFVRLDKSLGVEAVVHSHVGHPPFPSENDRAGCERLRRPWLIVSWPGRDWHVIEPCGWRPPLVGRCFLWGVHDCFSLIRDGLKFYAGIAIPDFERPWAFWAHGADLIGDNFEAAGFDVLPAGADPQHCDVFGMRFGGTVANHLALFVGPDQILHHPLGGLSQRALYDGLFQRATIQHFRHRSLANG
jgi:proteasome lid subunit RPN8/RPN11